MGRSNGHGPIDVSGVLFGWFMMRSSFYPMQDGRLVSRFFLQVVPQPAVRRFPRTADLQRITRLMSAEILGIGGRTDPRKVQPVGIPAGADGQIVVPLTAGVPFNGRDEQIKGIVVERDELATDGRGEPGCPRAMLRIPAFVFTADIVQEGEVLYDPGIGAVMQCQTQPVYPDTRPVRCAVKPIPVQAEFPAQQTDQLRCDHARNVQGRGISRRHRRQFSHHCG